MITQKRGGQNSSGEKQLDGTTGSLLVIITELEASQQGRKKCNLLLGQNKGGKQEVKENEVFRFKVLPPTSACSFTFHLGVCKG